MIDWPRAIVAGLVAGLVFALMEMILVATALGGPFWGPPRMMAGIVLGSGVLPPPGTFDFGIVAVGLIAHFALSVIYAVIIAFLIRSVSPPVGLAVGAAAGLALFFVNFYGFTAIFPWFANARNWVTIVSHIVFGLVVAFSYGPVRARAVAAS